MKLPENVVPMPAEQRAELKRLAEVSLADEPHLWYSGDDKPANVFSGDMPYIAAVSPDVALATLAYVEALEAENERLAARAAGLQAELAEQERRAMKAESLAEHWEFAAKSTHETNLGLEEERVRDAERMTEVEQIIQMDANTINGLKQEMAEQEASKLELVKIIVGIAGQLRNEACGLLTEAECKPFINNTNGAGTRTIWHTATRQGAAHLASLLLAEHFKKPAPTPPPSSPAAAGPGVTELLFERGREGGDRG